MRLRIACAVVVSVLMAGLICPAACALVCAGSHSTESPGRIPAMHHHHACESGTMDMPSVNTQPCHSNCSPAVKGLGSSSVSEGIFRPAVTLGVAPETSTARPLPALFPPVPVFNSGSCSDMSPSVLRI
jgi:hypothetical protein